MNLEILAPSLHCAAKGLISRHDVGERVWLLARIDKRRGSECLWKDVHVCAKAAGPHSSAAR